MPGTLGSTLGPYQILEQIGLGGMATVYKAYQPGMNRIVALKVLPEHYAHDPRFVKRFEREAQVVAKLEHSNIIPIYDYGSHNNITYLAMRYLQAGTVKDILAHGALPLADVAKLLSDISSALDYAHSQGIIHRDVKPSNILVDKQGNAYLTDFGIAKVLEGTADFTGSSVLGTPAYMAPEQTLGKPGTAQSDIYSLGVMLYEMVVGKPPFEADTPMAIALMHVHEPLPLPRRIKDDIPEAVELIILKVLAKNPKDRFQTANELARAFASAIGAETAIATSRLLELASGAAEGKGSEEVTYDVKEELKKRERTETRKRALRLAPIVGGGLGVVALIGAAIFLSSQITTIQNAQSTAMAAIVNIQSPRTPTPRATATIDINAAATLMALTVTPTVFVPPTITPTPHPAQIFAEPILKIIANRPPDIADDFSNPNSGWARLNNANYTEEGSYSISDSPSGGCGAVRRFPPLEINNFVLEIDERIVSGGQGEWMLALNAVVGGGYALSGGYGININTSGGIRITEPRVLIQYTYASTQGVFIKEGLNVTNHVQVIRKGSQVAAFVNEIPALIITDTRFNNALEIMFLACADTGSIRAEFDNLKIWNLTK